MKTIVFEVSNGIAKIRFNRPEKYNAFNREMSLALQDALDACTLDKTVRVICLRGAGKSFGSGQDLDEALQNNHLPIRNIVEEHYNPIIRKIIHLDKPIVAAVNGVAAGASANIALACDIVLAKSSASFIQAFSKIGLIPDSGGTYLLPRLIGFQKAKAIAMLGDRISAADAEKMGMIYKCVEDDEFENEVNTLLEKVAAMPTIGLGYTKFLFNASLENTLEEQLGLEGVYQEKAALTDDYKEGIQAFLEKRKPRFLGK